MRNDQFMKTDVGSCQGSVISPLISNIYLNKFDQKMMSKGLRIVRYADDILIFAKDQQTAGNNRTYAIKVLEEELKLKVNETKTKITSVREGVTFLGFVIYEKCLTINPKRIKRFKDKVRQMTKRGNRPEAEKYHQRSESCNPRMDELLSDCKYQEIIDRNNVMDTTQIANVEDETMENVQSHAQVNEKTRN